MGYTNSDSRLYKPVTAEAITWGNYSSSLPGQLSRFDIVHGTSLYGASFQWYLDWSASGFRFSLYGLEKGLQPWFLFTGTC